MDLMKLRFVAAGVLVVGAGAGLYALTRPNKVADKPVEAVDLQTQKAEKKKKEFLEAAAKYREMRALRNQKAEAPKNEVPTQVTNLRAIDRAVLDRLQRPAPEKDTLDVMPRDLAKVDLGVVTDNLTGKQEVRRVYLDLNRDGRRDEDWIVEGTEIKRRASPLDGPRGVEEEYKLEADGWALVKGTGAAAMQEPVARKPPPAPVELRDLDRRILGVVTQPPSFEGRINRDFASGQPARVQLVKNHRKTAIERVQIDFDRDEEWDELWFVRGKEVSRSVSPEDDGNYSERFALKNGKWQHM